MKNKLLKTGVFLISIFIVTWYGCETDPEETCQQDEICEAKFVTACCTDDACVYKYNGREYSEAQLDDLADDLGCSSVNVVVGESESLKADIASVTQQLKALMNRVKEATKTAKQ
jgi:hypothetical protein